MEILPGIIHGKTIELACNPTLADGEHVVVTIRPAESTRETVKPISLPGPPQDWQLHGEHTAGGCLADVWTDEDDRILAEIEQERQAARFREVGE